MPRKKNNPYRIALTLGNPNGIGPEVTVQTVSNFKNFSGGEFILIGDQQSFDRYFPARLPDFCRKVVIPVENDFRLTPGEKSFSSGIMSFRYLEHAVKLIRSGEADALVTAPLSKELIARSGLPGLENFSGHTEYLAEQAGVKKFSMMFHSSDLKIILVTIHIPLSRVPQAVTQDKLKIAIDNAISYCRKFRSSLSGRPRIAVCGLNPHAGENGLLGDEEMKVIQPVMESYRQDDFELAGPLPADTVFFWALKGHYDVVISLYHDQALAPFKLLHMHDGVNVTLGLPYIRTSPDHGTAWDIAGKNTANPDSMINAVRFALKWLEEDN